MKLDGVQANLMVNQDIVSPAFVRVRITGFAGRHFRRHDPRRCRDDVITRVGSALIK